MKRSGRFTVTKYPRPGGGGKLLHYLARKKVSRAPRGMNYNPLRIARARACANAMRGIGRLETKGGKKGQQDAISSLVPGTNPDKRIRREFLTRSDRSAAEAGHS